MIVRRIFFREGQKNPKSKFKYDFYLKLIKKKICNQNALFKNYIQTDNHP